jgi:hypothetical protein
MSKLCFIVSPIGTADSEQRIHADWVLRIIKTVMAGFEGYEVKRADQDARPGIIASQMISDLLNAELVIADLSFHNPNVFYEIGLRHMIQKPIIHMHLASWPFDVIPHRAMSFDLRKSQDLDAACDELKRQVEAVLAPGYVVENPVTNARGRIELQEHATPAEQLLIDQLQAIQDRLRWLEARETERDKMTLVTMGQDAGLPAPVFARDASARSRHLSGLFAKDPRSITSPEREPVDAFIREIYRARKLGEDEENKSKRESPPESPEPEPK